MAKLKEITFSSVSGVWFWHVLYDGDTVGQIVRHYFVIKGVPPKPWRFVWNADEPHGIPDRVRDAIFAAAKEKETLLNIARVLTQ